MNQGGFRSGLIFQIDLKDSALKSAFPFTVTIFLLLFPHFSSLRELSGACLDQICAFGLLIRTLTSFRFESVLKFLLGRRNRGPPPSHFTTIFESSHLLLHTLLLSFPFLRVSLHF
ncbi:unnamed protein product [Citrullus colocynthis]|uniref:Uncharacterized protein n=1 Tax=Citrullus colocynthis TaxID=252529 RepID=A0ABP0XWU3_9ROSI